MSVLLRADASHAIGSGHVMRCLTLATALRERGAAARFVCREHDGHLCDLIQEQGFTVTRLPLRERIPSDHDGLAHAAWLGGSWQDDAEGTRAALEAWGRKPEWLVVDHYALDHRWEQALRSSVQRLMVIDDLADRTHDCDLILDQNLVAEMDTRYVDKVPEACGLLLGPGYALLQPRFAEIHPSTRVRTGPIKRVLISFGGADLNNLTERSLRVFLSLNRPDIEVDVVMPARPSVVDAIRQLASGNDHIHLHEFLPTLAGLTAAADLAIGAAGASSWERLCLGLPALIVTLADNQVPIASELNRRELVRWIGGHADVSEEVMARALRDQIERGADANWSRRCLETVDGLGAGRVCAAMTVTAATKLRLRPATPADQSLLLELANDPTTRRTAFSPEQISPATHEAWFRARLEDSGACRLYIAETDDQDHAALGQVRFERHNRQWEVHYALARVFRRRGLGAVLVEAAIQTLRAEFPGAAVYGQVKIDNRPSRRTFERLGFPTQPAASAGVVVYPLEEGRTLFADAGKPICR